MSEEIKTALNTGNSILDQAPQDCNILSEESFAEFIDDQNIPQEGRLVISALATVSADDVTTRYHNFFGPLMRSANSEQATLEALQRQAEQSAKQLDKTQAADDSNAAEERRNSLLLDHGLIFLTQNYGSSVARAIARRLEER